MSESESNSEPAIAGAPGSPFENIAGRKVGLIERLEWICAILLSLLLLGLIITRTAHAGALWRDECDSLNLARMPRFSELLRHLQYTAFPLLFPVIVRTYTSLFGISDIALRCFGLLVGILTLGIAWFQSLSLNRRVPLLVLALIGLNFNFLTAGLWLRGYGLGSALIVLAFALTTKFLLQPSARLLIALFFSYLASMQCLYFNGVLVPSMVVAASIVLAIRRDWRWLWRLLGVAALCGLSYLPYLWTIFSSTRNWAVVIQAPVLFSSLVKQFLSACGGPDLTAAIVWRTIVVLCLMAGAWRLAMVWNANRPRERDVLLFALMTISFSLLTYFAFLRVMQNIPIPRYFLALVATIAAAATLIAVTIASRYWLQFGRIALIGLVIAAVYFAPWSIMTERNSGMGTVAQRVEKEAGPNDLIVVNQGSQSISFDRYYHGTARWVSVPAISDHKLHRYDLIQKKMMEFFPLDDVEKNISTTLKAGGRVWIVGTFGRSWNRPAVVLAPAPDPVFGWQSPYYVDAWSRELATFLQRHANRITSILPRAKGVSPWENPQLVVCEGSRY